MKNWLRRAKGSEVFFHNGLHGLYGFLSLGGSCPSDCSASGHRRLLRRKIRIIRAIRCKYIRNLSFKFLTPREFNWQVQSVLLYVVYLIVKNLLDSDSKQITVGIHFRFCVILQLFVICAAGSRIGFLCVSISFESL